MRVENKRACLSQRLDAFPSLMYSFPRTHTLTAFAIVAPSVCPQLYLTSLHHFHHTIIHPHSLFLQRLLNIHSSYPSHSFMRCQHSSALAFIALALVAINLPSVHSQSLLRRGQSKSSMPLLSKMCGYAYQTYFNLTS